MRGPVPDCDVELSGRGEQFEGCGKPKAGPAVARFIARSLLNFTFACTGTADLDHYHAPAVFNQRGPHHTSGRSDLAPSLMLRASSIPRLRSTFLAERPSRSHSRYDCHASGSRTAGLMTR